MPCLDERALTVGGVHGRESSQTRTDRPRFGQTSPMPPMPKKTPPKPKSGPNRNLLIALGAVAAIVAAIVIGVLALGGGGGAPSTPRPPRTSTGSHRRGAELGSPDATVTMIQFEDIQCPVCKEYTDGAQQDVVEQYVKPGKVKLRFVGLAFIGPDSEKALRYTLAAGKEGKLWQFSELLYANQGPENSGWVTDSLLESIATALGLDWDALKAEAASASVTQQQNAMTAEAQLRRSAVRRRSSSRSARTTPYQVNPQGFSIEAFTPIFEDALSQP